MLAQLGGEMKTFKEIQAMYPYQFGGPNMGISVANGWLACVEQLCLNIDLALGENKHGFHWTQIKEKFGSARFHYQTTSTKDRAADKAVTDQINRQISITMAAINHICIVCGEPGSPDHSDDYTLLLCPKHKQARLAGEKLNIWPKESI
jgi:hypothetical protein